ncbi:MAG: hypothetical protein GC159_17495 [Phycisphaera sp.]|nr:hypothetical protein [Phycisphaera sp.]
MDFQIIIDTRETEAYEFPCHCIRRKLDAGDYSVLGHERRVAVERKSLRDFVGTVIHNAARFDAELLRLQSLDRACVVVEADLDKVLRGYERKSLRDVSPASILGASIRIQHAFNVPVIWCGSRQAAHRYTENFLRMFVRLASIVEVSRD